MRGESKYHYVALSLIEDPQGVVHPSKTSQGGSITLERAFVQR